MAREYTSFHLKCINVLCINNVYNCLAAAAAVFRQNVAYTFFIHLHASGSNINEITRNKRLQQHCAHTRLIYSLHIRTYGAAYVCAHHWQLAPLAHPAQHTTRKHTYSTDKLGHDTLLNIYHLLEWEKKRKKKKKNSEMKNTQMRPASQHFTRENVMISLLQFECVKWNVMETAHTHRTQKHSKQKYFSFSCFFFLLLFITIALVVPSQFTLADDGSSIYDILCKRWKKRENSWLNALIHWIAFMVVKAKEMRRGRRACEEGEHRFKTPTQKPLKYILLFFFRFECA